MEQETGLLTSTSVGVSDLAESGGTQIKRSLGALWALVGDLHVHRAGYQTTRTHRQRTDVDREREREGGLTGTGDSDTSSTVGGILPLISRPGGEHLQVPGGDKRGEAM